MLLILLKHVTPEEYVLPKQSPTHQSPKNDAEYIHNLKKV